eukprot:6642684-Pyramimonas_sp.AAC.1
MGVWHAIVREDIKCLEAHGGPDDRTGGIPVGKWVGMAREAPCSWNSTDRRTVAIFNPVEQRPARASCPGGG